MSPQKYLYLTVGELPPPSQRTARQTQSAGIVLPFRKPEPRVEVLEPGTVSYFDVPENSKWGREANRLRHSILALQVQDISSSVKQALVELCEGLASKNDDVYSRAVVLKHTLETRLGLCFRRAVDLPVECYFEFAWPDRLLRNYPEFTGLHALAWHAMRIA